MPFDAVAKFPRGVRYHVVAPLWWQQLTRRAQTAVLPDPPCPPFYRAALPFPHALQRVTTGGASSLSTSAVLP